MIPIRLKLAGFLSYRDQVELDLTSVDLACISGSNGAGKSALLDAITWSLFGKARKNDESIINLQSKTAEVDLTFSYEGNLYRVLRSISRGKTQLLEFQIQQLSEEWRPLTEHTLRETQRRIEGILHLDYDTFVNAAFFLQGKADQFAQLPPTRRKDILSSILGLEAWEIYKERAADLRKGLERDQELGDAHLQEIDAELSEEPARTQKLRSLSEEVQRLNSMRKAQEVLLANAKQVRASLENQKLLVQNMQQTLERNQENLNAFQTRTDLKQEERSSHASLVTRAAEVESAYSNWHASRVELERLDAVFKEFHAHDERRQPLLREIEAERARLEQEKQALVQQQKLNTEQIANQEILVVELASARQGLSEVDARLQEGDGLQKRSQELHEKQAELKTNNARLKKDMDELNERINKLKSAEGASCPLCGQNLSPEHRSSTIKQLTAEGTEMGDLYRANKSVLDEIAGQIATVESRLAGLMSAEHERVTGNALISQLVERSENTQVQIAEWKQTGAKRLAVVEKQLAGSKFALEARKKLSKLDEELATLGYDAAAHDLSRGKEMQQRVAEVEFRKLEAARAALKPLDDEITNLKAQIKELGQVVETGQKGFNDMVARLGEDETRCPDVISVERTLFDLQEQENRLNQEVGAARQKVNVLDELRSRKTCLNSDRETRSLQIGRYRTLERAFGKDGVPALLIEQALPEIEIKANEILDRLSDGTMSVKFLTQSAYKDKKRDDLKETLDIQISDGAGMRDYELYSGGEAFRVNFAIRLALSEVLAKRKGARLQTLVIDEGFGSQDTQGRQRLVEAINSVRNDFARILVITHLDELKDAFPTRIEVEKTARGSSARII